METPPQQTPSTGKQIAKSALAAIIGTLPGLFCLFVLDYGPIATLVIVVLGVAIGVGFSLPGVSSERVFRGAAGMLPAHNMRVGRKEPVFNAIMDDSKSQPAPTAENTKALDPQALPPNQNPQTTNG